MDISPEQLEQAVADSSFCQELTEIRRDLQANRASVLVGSGFSKNANKDMPTWDKWASDLADEMQVNKSTIRAQDVPWLAGAYAERHGLSKMREFLLDPLCAKEMLKNDIHEQLVCLPWVDIFTTNYDQFLEQAAKNALDNGRLGKPYKTFKTSDNLMRPRNEYRSRIIKLHGCLTQKQENDRCIITEDDYRTYRERYASLVNTVRQSLLETSMCLIGYSATDPDFLEWIGWVRDKLPGDHLKIYLFSIKEHNENEIYKYHQENKKYIYIQRGITYIDLDCFTKIPLSLDMTTNTSVDCAPNAIENKKIDIYYKTYTLFLRWLSQKEASDKNDDTEASECWDCPDISDVRFGRKDLSWGDIQELSKRIKQARETYPGWLLPSIKTLRRLWDLHIDAHSLVLKIIKMRSSVSESELLTPLHEVCWLLDMACLPTFNKLDKSLEEVLAASFLPKTSEEASRWMACSRLLVRWAREERDEKLFTNTVKKTGKIA